MTEGGVHAEAELVRDGCLRIRRDCRGSRDLSPEAGALHSAFAPGSAPDIVARMLGEPLGAIWRQQVVVENKPGAVGNIGTAHVAKAAPDGYTVLVTASVIAVNATLWLNPGGHAIFIINQTGKVVGRIQGK